MLTTTLCWIATLYVLVMAVTFGHLYRQYGKLRPRHYAFVLAAPLWWIASKGVKGTLDAMDSTILGHPILWGVGLVAVGHYLARSGQCSSLSTCSITGIKAAFISLPPVAFVYWGSVFAG